MRFFFDMNVTFLSSRFSFFVAHDVPRLHFIGDLPACFTLSSSSLLRTLLLSDTYDQWAIKYLIISYSARRRNYKKMRRGKNSKRQKSKRRKRVDPNASAASTDAVAAPDTVATPSAELISECAAVQCWTRRPPAPLPWMCNDAAWPGMHHPGSQIGMRLHVSAVAVEQW